MIRFIKRWLHRRDIQRRIIAYAKTTEGQKCFETINNNNQILADYEKEVFGVDKVSMPNKLWRLINIP